MSHKRRIAVITSSRADFGHLYWPLQHLRECPDVDLRLIAMAAHLSTEFGHTIDEIKSEGFKVDETVECLLSSDTDTGMAKTIGVAALGLADVLDRMRPDILLLIADRYEMLAPASVALALRIPVAHIEGGEISEGAVDDAVRNALTKLSHIHFTPTEQASLRVQSIGEEAWRIHQVGAPSLDHLAKRNLLDRATLNAQLGIDLAEEFFVVSYHPVTLKRNTIEEADAVFEALAKIGQQLIICFPNADAGSRQLIARSRGFCESLKSAHLFVNLNHLSYWSLLRHASVLIGNSSSGIMETPSLALPAVNIGMRQQGRERAINIIDVDADASAILEAVERAGDRRFKDTLKNMSNPYGDGHAGERIAQVLSSVELGDQLLIKKAISAPVLTV